MLAGHLASTDVGRNEQAIVAALGGYWHPVAYSEAVTDKPMAVELLGERLVVVRFSHGPRVYADLCVHRGVALSLGWLDDDRLRCAYHGWCYDDTGRCVEIPSNPGQRIPDRARLRSYPAREVDGLVWACLVDEPRFGVPPFPEWTDSAFRVVTIPHYDWNCGAHRRTENFVDLAHLPWVHEGVLGDRTHAETPVHTVERRDDHLAMHSDVDEEQNMKSAPNREHPGRVHTVNDWRVYPACSIHWLQRFDDGRRFGMFIVASPLDGGRCRTFSMVFRDFDLDGNDDDYTSFQLEIVEADRAIAESQRPEELPVDLTAELHVKGADTLSIEYRRWLIDLAREQPDRTSAHSHPTSAPPADQ